MAIRHGRIQLRGRSRPKAAVYPGTCAKCHLPIHVGDMFCFDSIPEPRSRYHEGCESVEPEYQPLPPERPVGEDTESSPTTWQVPVDDKPVTHSPAIFGGSSNSIDDIIDARIAEALGDFKPQEALTAEKALEIAKKAIDENLIKSLVEKFTKPTEIVFRIKQPPPMPDSIIKNEHFIFARVANLVRNGNCVALWGPPGTGKTELAKRIAVFLKREYELETLDRSTTRSAVLGYKDVNGKPVWTPFLTAYRDGKIAILDELDAADGAVHVLYNTALAGDRAPAAWEGGVKRHKNFGFIGTMNTPGAGPTADFPDRKLMGPALKDRLYFVYVPKDDNIVNRIVGLPLEKVPERRMTTCTPAEWVTWCRKVKAWAVTGAATAMWRIGQRAELEGAKALAIGETVTEVAHGLIFRGSDDALVNKCLLAVPLPERPMTEAE